MDEQDRKSLSVAMGVLRGLQGEFPYEVKEKDWEFRLSGGRDVREKSEITWDCVADYNQRLYGAAVDRANTLYESCVIEASPQLHQNFSSVMKAQSNVFVQFTEDGRRKAIANVMRLARAFCEECEAFILRLPACSKARQRFEREREREESRKAASESLRQKDKADRLANASRKKAEKRTRDRAITDRQKTLASQSQGSGKYVVVSGKAKKEKKGKRRKK